MFTHCSPPSSLIFLVLTFVWQPAPFQLPVTGLGSSVATTPKSSHTRCSRKRATHRWSPILMPSQGPTWNSHWSQKKDIGLLYVTFQTKEFELMWLCFLHPVDSNNAANYLRWHHFSIRTTDFDPCVETGLVVALHNVPSISIVCPHWTVVLALK